ncbi:unnamed protein product [Absidia cylindrospora]
MFMFSPGFEAASLKWHSKDQDDDSATTSTSTTTTNTSNTTAAAPTSGTSIIATSANALPTTSMTGKKQMIGFAKFRSRLEALEAVDVISGKKVDPEKGLILKAEMAKKNLHVKRGSIAPTANTTMTTTTTDTTPSSSSPLESLPFGNFNGNSNGLGNNNNSKINNITNKNLLSAYHEPFGFSPLPSDLLSPMVDYDSDPFAGAASDYQHHQQKSQSMTPTTPVFNDNFFGFRSYSIDGRNGNSNNGNSYGGSNLATSFDSNNNSNNALGIAPRPSISSTTSFTKRMSIKPHNPMSVPEDISLDPFHYLSKSSPAPIDHVGSYFSSDDAAFGPLVNNGMNGLRTDYSGMSSTAHPQRSNSLLMTSPPQRPSPMIINNSSNSTTSNNGNGFMNNSNIMTAPTPATASLASATATTSNLADQNPPCNTLYVGNLPPNTNEDELRQLFSKCTGYKRMYFRTKPQGPMCFVEFDDVMFATQTMADLQGHSLSNSVKGGIRLSFSKNPLFIKPNKASSSSSSSSSSTTTDQQQRTMASASRDFIFDPQL